MNRLRQLRKASFRGVRFDVDDTGKEFGQRYVTHEYPGRDDPFHEQMGEGVQSFSVEAFIIGDDFISRAAALEAAIRKKGPGTLIHPIHGHVEVVAIYPCRRQESSQAVGEVRFSLTFEPYSGAKFPSILGSTASAVALASENMLDALSGDFSDFFEIANLPDFISADAEGRISSLLSNLDTVLGIAGLSDFIPASLPSLFSSTLSLGDRVVDFFRSLGNSSKPKSMPMISGKFPAAPVAPALPMSSALANNGLFSTPVTDPANGSRRDNNGRALNNLFQASSLTAAAASSRSSIYESREQAIAFRDSFVLQMDAIGDRLGEDGWDRSWQTSKSLVSAVVRDINDRIGRLPRTITVETRTTRTSLELANRLYGDDPSKIFVCAADIAQRNRVGHPGFVPAKKLEVLIDASSK